MVVRAKGGIGEGEFTIAFVAEFETIRCTRKLRSARSGLTRVPTLRSG
jgi:hypothetical protein